ncbi:hypothetical protein [Clostridium sp. D46t1_190503_E9]|uniref:hypothetical protein n=1 Tax=Clostridium sp. D46t1_190503_E9 TaxID=2787137 RepID=UPI001897220A|nr:hypothetical protein [Clostridium sp. D46t1_190503_E9]
MQNVIYEVAIDSSNDEENVTLEDDQAAIINNNTNSNNNTSGLNDTSDALNHSSSNPVDDAVAKVTTLSAALNSMQTNIGSIIIGGEEEKYFYDRKVKPLLDELYFLSLSAQGISIAAQNLQSNAYAKKRQIKLPVDLTYEIVKEAYCILDTLKKRNAIYRRAVENDIERCGDLPSDYKSCFDCLDEEDKKFNDDNEKDDDCGED